MSYYNVAIVRGYLVTTFMGLFLAAGCSSAQSHPPDAKQEAPQEVTIQELIHNPILYDGKLVRVRAIYGMGWEGDNFLYGPPKTSKAEFTLYPSQVWFYPSANDPEVSYEAARAAPAIATFTGYFRFVTTPSVVHRVFDRGSLHLEVTQVTDFENAFPKFPVY